MPRDYKLDRLKSEEQAAFRRKQSAWKDYADAKECANTAHDEMESAWQERCRAREEMNHEFEIMQITSARYKEIWDEYGRIRDYNNSRIELLRYDADYEHREMQMCFDNASSEYSYGDKSMAPVYAEEGREHKERRDELNAEISELIAEIRNAKEHAQYAAPRTNADAFHRAKDRFEDAKSVHQAAEREFKNRKAERDRLKAIFEEAQAEHTRTKEAFQNRLAEVKASRQHERNRTLDKAGIYGSSRKDAKIVKKSDGTTQIYHGGIGKADGLGHGHTTLDQAGHKTYDRKSFSAHGSQNFTDEKTGWSPREWGVVGDDHKVTFRQGLGANEGQTLISDGHISGKEFNKHHSHYGSNDKNRFPDQPDRIEDSDKHKGDDAYTGPGR